MNTIYFTTIYFLVLFQATNQIPERCKPTPPKDYCRGYFVRYFYNITSEKCEQYIFGGCRKNENFFENITECQKICVQYQNKSDRSYKIAYKHQTKYSRQNIETNYSWPNIETNYSIPDIETNYSWPNIETNYSIPDIETNYSMQHIESNYAIPDTETNYSWPEIEVNYSIPDIETNYSIPDIETNYSIPDIETNYSRPDTETNYSWPEIEVNYSIPHNETNNEIQMKNLNPKCEKTHRDDDCIYNKVLGRRALLIKFIYNETTSHCDPIIYNLCNTNATLFDSIDECAMNCLNEQE